MRILVGAAVVALSVGWLVAGRFRTPRTWRVLPALVALPALAFTLNEVRWWHFEHGLADAVRPVLAGHDSGFGCERLMHDFFSSQGRSGHVWFDANGVPAREAFLSMDTCAGVKAYQHDPRSASMADVVAVHTVTHEAEHLAGQRSEAVAECSAIQADARVMVALGADAATARAQTRSYLTTIYPRLSGDYVDGECRADGTLDRTPGDGVWP
ncbi:hypothetical protein [Angustibacter luteus]|uniref:Uncharacterized protein n=1 Tax=Angustibacter luteus TaxID=658456 RepID=A0ABW1JCR2_9ACTN